MPLDALRSDFRELAPWPSGIRFLNGPTERILQNQLPPRPDNPSRSLLGSTANLAADSAFAERSSGGREVDMVVTGERRLTLKLSASCHRRHLFRRSSFRIWAMA
jgi:hypothetical protein